MPTVGEMAPGFELLSDRSEKFKLTDLCGKKVILYFYSKAGTAG